MQLEVDIAQYILENKEIFLDEVRSVVKKFIIISDQIPQFKEQFDNQYEEQLLNFIRIYLLSAIYPLNSEDLNVIINKQFIEQLLGTDYFIYKE